jgi:hypothetical protein
MSTVAQTFANHQNAQKSTGPKSIEGKAISAKNAVKHGLFAAETVIKGENRDDFNLFRDKLLEEFDPQGAVEIMLAERIVSLGWRLKRIVRIQDQVFDVMIEKDEPSPYQKQLNSMLPRAMRDDPRGAGPDLVLGRAVISDFSNSRVLERLLMYERRLENSLNKTMDELHKRKLIRQLEQANKAVEEEEFEKLDHPQASLGAATQRLAPKPALGVNPASPSFAGIKNAKQTQSFGKLRTGPASLKAMPDRSLKTENRIRNTDNRKKCEKAVIISHLT